MKTILVPTDFSVCAQNATLYAAKWAQILKAKIILFNVDIQSSKLESKTDDNIENQNVAHNPKLDVLANLLHTEFSGNIEKVTQKSTGKQSDAIVKFARENNIDFIVMGTEGRSGHLGKMIGSVTSAVIGKIEIPVFAVPGHFKFVDIKSIIVGCEDADTLTDDIVRNIKYLTHLVNANLIIMKVYDASYFDKPGNEKIEKEIIDRKFNEETARFEYLFDTNIIEGLNKAAKSESADLVIMLPQKQSWFDRIFNTSVSKNFSLQTNLPTLFLPYNISENSLQKSLSV